MTETTHPAAPPTGRGPLVRHGRPDQDGRPRPADTSRQVGCACVLPLRETAELPLDLAQRAERSGEDPLDPLRRPPARPDPRRWEPDDPGDGEHGPPWTVSGP